MQIREQAAPFFGVDGQNSNLNMVPGAHTSSKAKMIESEVSDSMIPGIPKGTGINMKYIGSLNTDIDLETVEDGTLDVSANASADVSVH